jgi:hypothetical protein
VHKGLGKSFSINHLKNKNHMKNFIILTTLLAFSMASFAQQDTTIKQQTAPNSMQAKPNTYWKESDLYKKSKTQKIVGWSLIGAGMIGMSVTLAADFNQGTENTVGRIFGEKQPYKSYTTYYVINSAVIAGGMYLLIKSTINKKAAMAGSVFIDMEKAQVLQGNAFSYQSFPVVGLKIPL